MGTDPFVVVSSKLVLLTVLSEGNAKILVLYLEDSVLETETERD